MSPDIRSALKQAAATPADEPRIDAIVARGQRFRAQRYAAISITAAMCLAAGLAVVQTDVLNELFARDVDPVEEDRNEQGEVVRLPAETLIADLTTETKWPSGGIHIPFGSSQEQLAYEPSNESAALIPESFAIAPDGLWITDFGNERLVHYSQDGEFLGEIKVPDSPVGSKRAYLEDIVFVGDRMFVMLSSGDGRVAEISPITGEQRRFTITHQDRALFLASLSSAGGHLYASVAGYVDDIGADGPEDFVLVDPNSGTAEPTAGLPLGNGTLVSFEHFSFDRGRFTVRFSSDQGWLQPVTVRARLDDGQQTVDRPTLAGLGMESLVPGTDEVALTLGIQARTERGADYDGGSWLLRMREPDRGGGAVASWEPIPEEIWDGRRNLCWGPDGSLYVMLRSREGVTILRYP